MPGTPPAATPSARLPLSDTVFALLRGLVEEKLGLHYEHVDRELLTTRLSTRVDELGFASMLDYYYYLRYDPSGPAEMSTLTEALVVNETYLFRELDQLEVVASRVISSIVAERGRARVWSAACSTGDEPLTLAMLLHREGLLSRTELVASDISDRVLAIARSGRLGRRSMRRDQMPAFATRFIRPLSDGAYEVDASLVARVDWRRINLMDRPAIDALGQFDVILCRNVLIYFSDSTSVRLVESFHKALRPGGALFVSVSESLLRFGTALACEEQAGVFLYRKARETARQP